MRIWLACFALVVLTASASARTWPKWLPAHVSEIRLRTGQPNARVRTITDPREIEPVLGALRRAAVVRKVTWRARIFGDRETEKPREWQASIDVSGERPEAGSWLVNLDTGEITFLDPSIQPIYRLRPDDLRMFQVMFQRGKSVIL